MYIIIVQLGDILNNAFKYYLIVIDLMCQKVTLTLVYLIKYIRVYTFSNSMQLNI